MKKHSDFIAIVIALVFLSANVFAAEEAAGNSDLLCGMGKKLVRGTVNLLTGWVELPMQTVKGIQGKFPGCEDNKIAGAVYGFFKGVGCTIGRTVWGAIELAGFWTANPKDNEGFGLPLDGEYAWEEGESYNYFEPDFNRATIQPIGSKLLRGLGNSLLGFVEFPGQIAKGIENKSWDLGVVKGLWFWYSREIYGAGDIATLIFPIPKDNPGYAFDEEYPWDALVDAVGK